MTSPAVHIVGVVLRDPEQLVANPSNFRIHPKVQQEAMRASLEMNGWIAPLIENRRTGYLIDGHLRALVAMELGLTEVPVLLIDVEPESEGQALLCLDPIAAMAIADRGLVQDLVAKITTESTALAAMLQDLLAKSVVTDADPDPERVTERRRRAVKFLLSEAKRLKRHIDEEIERQYREGEDTAELEEAKDQVDAVIETLEGWEE